LLEVNWLRVDCFRLSNDRKYSILSDGMAAILAARFGRPG
jgi:hypothetical protein